MAIGNYTLNQWIDLTVFLWGFPAASPLISGPQLRGVCGSRDPCADRKFCRTAAQRTPLRHTCRRNEPSERHTMGTCLCCDKTDPGEAFVPWFSRLELPN